MRLQTLMIVSHLYSQSFDVWLYTIARVVQTFY